MRKTDLSKRVDQRDKIKEEFSIKTFPWTQKQQKFIDLALKKDTKVMICDACPGVGKTLLSLYCSLVKLRDKKVSHIVYLRVPIESSRSIGYLSGSAEEKLAPFMFPIADNVGNLIDKATYNYLLNDERIVINTLGHIQGRTFNGAAIIFDEAGDGNERALRLLMTRLGNFSTLFIIGDAKQANVNDSYFGKVYKAFKNSESEALGIHTFEFSSEDSLRSPITKHIIEVFDKIH